MAVLFIFIHHVEMINFRMLPHIEVYLLLFPDSLGSAPLRTEDPCLEPSWHKTLLKTPSHGCIVDLIERTSLREANRTPGENNLVYIVLPELMCEVAPFVYQQVLLQVVRIKESFPVSQ